MTASHETTVVFDLDGTLLDGDSTMSWMADRIRRSWVRLGVSIIVSPLVCVLLCHSRSRQWGASVALWIASAGQSKEALCESFSAFGDEVFAGGGPIHWREDGLATLRKHIDREDRVVIATAAPMWLAKRMIDRLGLPTISVVGSTLGAKFGGWIGVRHCRHLAKCDALRGAGFGTHWAAAYTDSIDDLPLLARADRAWLVNGSSKALEKCAQHGVAAELIAW